MFTGLLPIGTVVLLKDSTKRVMVIGFCQTEATDNNEEKIWDYVGCLYPEGYLKPDEIYLFNGEQIDKIFTLGYQDEEQFEFKKRADAVHKELKNKMQASLE